MVSAEGRMLSLHIPPIYRKEFLLGVEQNSGPFAALRWVKLRGEEAMRRSKDLFKRAEALQNLLLLGNTPDKEAIEMQAQIQILSQLATRLSFQAKEEEDEARAKAMASIRRQNSEKAGRRDIIRVTEYLPHRRSLSSLSSLSQVKERRKRRINTPYKMVVSSCMLFAPLSLLHTEI